MYKSLVYLFINSSSKRYIPCLMRNNFTYKVIGMRYHWTCSFHIILKVRLYSWKYIERTKNKEINTVYTCECITHKAKIKWLCATMHRMSKKEQKSTCLCMQFLKFILFIAHSLVNKMIVFTNIFIHLLESVQEEGKICLYCSTKVICECKQV